MTNFSRLIWYLWSQKILSGRTCSLAVVSALQVPHIFLAYLCKFDDIGACSLVVTSLVVSPLPLQPIFVTYLCRFDDIWAHLQIYCSLLHTLAVLPHRCLCYANCKMTNFGRLIWCLWSQKASTARGIVGRNQTGSFSHCLTIRFSLVEPAVWR